MSTSPSLLEQYSIGILTLFDISNVFINSKTETPTPVPKLKKDFHNFS